MGKESNLNRLMRERCAALPGCVYYKNHGTQMGIAGRTDIEVIYCGQVLFIETKVNNNALSRRQQVEHCRLLTAGASVTTCTTIKKFDDLLITMATQGGKVQEHNRRKKT